MAKARTKTPGLGFKLFQAPPKSRDYISLSMRPLHILVFLLPLVVLYEVGSFVYLMHPSSGMVETIGAHSILAGFFNMFGAASLHLPPILLVVVLLVWHFVEKDPFGIRPSALLGMLAESVLWTLPLLVFGLLFQRHLAAMPYPQDVLAGLSQGAKLTLSAGAGVYEELLFRLLLITVIHFIVSDIFGASKSVGYTVGAVVSAVAFAMYHNIAYPGGGVDIRLLTYYTVAGLYFAALFILRGLGIAVASHFLFDAVVLLAIPAGWGQHA